MRYAFSSPLKAIQGSAIQDLTDGRFGELGRAQSPRWWPTDRSYSSLTTSLEPHGLRLSSVSIPTKPRYIPNQRPAPQVRSTVPKGAAGQKDISRKFVKSRFLLVDGSISFVVGTQIDGVITPDAKEVPIAKILDHVSPAELERFENQDFFNEDERERLLPPRKPRGRPRAGDRILPSFNVAPISQATSKEHSLLPDGSITIKKKGGRPKGSLNKRTILLNSAGPSSPFKGPVGRPGGSHTSGPYERKAANFMSTKPSTLTESSTSIKKPRGRPPRQKNLSVVVPSFDGPQPQELESTPGAETESDEMSADPKPQYAMVVASGLGQSDTEEPTSRDQSVKPEPSSKKRRFVTSNGHIDLESDTDGGERSPHPSKRMKFFPETSPDPIADDSAALIRQFQARVYGPDHSAKPSTIPHRQSKPGSTLNGSTALPARSQAHARSSSPGSASSDSLMGPTQPSLKTFPAVHVPNTNKPPPAEAIPQSPYPGDKLDKVLESNVTNSKTASHFSHHGPVKPTPTKSNSPSEVIRRRAGLTPHFPPGMKLSTNFSSHSSSESRSHPSVSSASRHGPSQQANTTFSQSSRSKPAPPKNKKSSLPPPRKKPSPSPRSTAPPPHSSQPSSSTSKSNFAALPPAPSKRKKPSPSPQIAPPTKSSQPPPSSSKTSRIGFANLPPAKHITDYFAPKPPAPPKNPAAHSPSLQLLGAAAAAEENSSESSESSESEDHLARRPPSSDKDPSSDADSDNNSTSPEEIIIVRQQARSSPANGNTRPSFTEHDRMDIDSMVTDSEDGGKYDTARRSHTAVAIGYTAGTEETRGSGGGLGQGFEIGEEGEEEEEEGEEEENMDSSSDSVSSEVMVVRARVED